MNSDVERARVTSAGGEGSSTLFPMEAYTRPRPNPRDVCTHRGLNWLAAIKLYQDGWLSFDPEAVMELNAAQEAELVFLGSLAVAGCDESLLRQLLQGLHKPYAYRMEALHYDWVHREWELHPTGGDLQRRFDAWIRQLTDTGQLAALENLRARVDSAIRDLRQTGLW